MRQSLRDILEMKQHNLKIPGLRVNILEEIEPEVFIVQDETKVAILKVAEEYIDYVKVGKSLMVKPKKLNDFCIAHTHKKISPQHAKLLDIAEPDEETITNLKQRFKSSKDNEENGEKFTDELGNTCDQANQDPDFSNERGWAETIIQHIRKIKQPFRLDRLTKGNGSCLMIALMQQLRRKDIYHKGRSEVQELARSLDHREFRKRVKLFTTTTEDPRLRELREHYNNSAEPKLWNQYWEDMLGVTWADHYFIRASAIYLDFNIEIITTSTTKEQPSITVPCGLPGRQTLWIGNITDLHYQSILIDKTHKSEDIKDDLSPNDSKKQQKEMQNKDSANKNNLDQCPVCKKFFQQLNRHIKLKRSCQAQIEKDDLAEIEKGSEESSANRKKRLRQRRKDENPEQLKKYEREVKARQRKRKREEDPEQLMSYEKDMKARQRKRMKEEDLKTYLEAQNDQKMRSRKVETEADRLREFRDATMLSALFVCISCHCKTFKSNVQEFTDKIMSEIAAKIPLEDCIADLQVKTKIIIMGEKTSSEEDGTRYICITCLKKLKVGKLPSKSVMNNLQLHDTDEKLRLNDLIMTELEGSLIAKNLIFQKIFLLPRSRWTALKDRVINVPITDEAINETIKMLPRTPNEAGLIGLELKRKIEMKNNHKQQLINPTKIFKWLRRLKDSGNPYYDDVSAPEDFKRRCRDTDKDGHEIIYGNDDQIEENVDICEKEQMIEVEDELQNEEDEDTNKDPSRKFNFTYDRSVCMMAKYPEITIAPGEGQKPKGILTDLNWDVKAFPHLHNPDGSNGKDEKRKVKLTDQWYFIQRLINKEMRFSQSPDYLYSAVAYLEQKQICNNIALVGVRGKEVHGTDGQKCFQLEDEYRVLENMKNTPKYWQKMKYEILAKIDNLGAFQLFFTLSCADQRWSANMAEIMVNKGFTVRFFRNRTNDDQEPIIEVRTVDGNWKPLMQFIKEDVKESLQELIRGNVVSATRYFHHRVKTFINKILLAKSNPLSVQYYSYKVEIQERGAPHVHGVLWLNLGELENLSMVEGKLSNTRTSDKKPLKGIGEVFKRIKQSQKLTKEDKSVLVKWIDAFITVSTHPDTVGHDVAAIARAVNMHHCTKTCRKKGGCKCRFKFPRPPSPKTIIQEKPKEGNEEKRNQSVAKGLETIRKVMEVLEDEKNIEKIMSQFDKETETSEEMKKNRKIRINNVCMLAGVSYQDYIEALEMTSSGYKVVLARDIDELQINPYNKEMIRAWNGNMDLQPVLDFFAVVTYVADYYGKEDTGMMELLKAATEDSSTKDVKDRMKQISNIFQMTRQIGEAEAVYRLIPSMTMSMSNIKCVFVATGPKEERSVRWKKATEDQLNQVNGIKIADRDGIWFQQPDLWSKYLRRPGEIKDITFSQFAKMYVGKSRKGEDEDEVEEAIDDHEEEDDSDDDDVNKFDYIMTFKNNGSKGKKLPDIIKLSDPAPGEAQFMTKRTFPSTLRFRKEKAENHKRFMLNELMLYCPLDDEVKEDEIEIKYNDLHGKKRKVDIVKNQVMEHLEGVQEARYQVAQMQKELDIDLNEVAALDLDPAGYHDNEDCASEGDEENENFQHCNPDQLNIGSDEKNEPALFRKIEVPSILSILDLLWWL